MGIFARIKTWFHSEVNSAMDKIEVPEKMLNQLLLDMNNNLIEVKKSVALALADEKKLERDTQNQEDIAKNWEEKAKLAVKAGKDDLAKEALLRKQEYDTAAGEYRKQWEYQHAAVERLKISLRELQNKIEETNRKKNLLIAKAKRADAQKRIADSMTKISNNGKSFEVFDRMERKVDQIAAEADAAMELEDFSKDNDLESKFKQLELESNDADKLLEELKAKMTQFSFEQTRIERMEDDFKRLLQTQVSVEEKLKSLTGADDALQDIQIKMRKLNDLMNETEEKFQRIEHKNQTLEETNSGIDRNFKTLQESEKTAQQFINDLQRVNIGLEDIRASIEKLTAENDKAKETSEKALELNNLLGDIELRITQMKKDQMWFANLETRIDEAKKDVHQSIKTIGAIQKKEGDRIQLDKDGGIPISVQEQVLILKKDGWTDKEIASNLKISIGAIQLIVDAKSREL
jgi:phage shock protein A